MAVNPQYLHGSTREAIIPFDTANTTIAFVPGDFVTVTSGNASLTVAATSAFVGLSAQKKAAGVTQIFGNSTPGVIRVDCDGVWEFDKGDTIAMNVGDLVGISAARTVQKVADETVSIGRCYKAAAANSARLQVKINCAVLPAARTT